MLVMSDYPHLFVHFGDLGWYGLRNGSVASPELTPNNDNPLYHDMLELEGEPDQEDEVHTAKRAIHDFLND